MILWAIRSCIDRLVYRCSPAAREALAARRTEATKRRDQAALEACDICSGRKRYFCAVCREPIKFHSHENDFMCETHGFVNVIRDGVCGQPRVVA